MIEYRCHIQHVYTAEVSAVAQFEQTEKLLREAERSVNEHAELCRQMADRANTAGAVDDKLRWSAASLHPIDWAHELRDLVEQDRIRAETDAQQPGAASSRP